MACAEACLTATAVRRTFTDDSQLPSADLPEALQQLVSGDGLQWTQHDVQLDYSHLGAEEVLKVRGSPAWLQAPW